MDVKISSNFKNQTLKAISSIVLFLIFFVLLLALGAGLAIACFYVGLLIISSKIMFLTIIIAIGIFGIGLSVLFFLIKFIFSHNKTDVSEFTEIIRTQHPKLFLLIDEIVLETNTKFPKHVYISSQVNASVFYDSSFWSMFLPVKKNLHIGLGLVNSVTKDELKAILSHEFGHFSQKTMKVGSYVYQVNKIIHNMLFENVSFYKLIDTWSSINGYFSIFALIAIKIIEGIQWLLQRMYVVVNKSYLALSREMEFHADEIAANVAGSEAVITSLMRIELADLSFSNVLSIYNEKLKESFISENIFKNHLYMMNFIAISNKIPIINSFPQVSLLEQKRLIKSKINIEDQWSSHPSTDDRVSAVEKLNIVKAKLDFSPAIELFEDTENFQKRITRKLFSDVVETNEIQFLNDTIFIDEVNIKFKSYNYDERYNEYYDFISPTEINTNFIEGQIEFDELFSNDIVNQLIEMQILENDISILESINSNEYQIRKFSYDGYNYDIKEVSSLLEKLNFKLCKLKKLLDDNNSKIYNFFHLLSNKLGQRIKYEEIVNSYLKSIKEYNENQELVNNAYLKLNFVSINTPFEEIKSNFENFKIIEFSLKKFLIEAKDRDCFNSILSLSEIEKVKLYIKEELIYFKENKYNNDSLSILFNVLNIINILNKNLFLNKKKDMLDYQMMILN